MRKAWRGPGRCQQVWCPVCALAALASGDQHPMLTAIAEHSVTLMAMVRAMVADPQAPAESDSDGEPDGGLGNASADTAENGSRYQPIPIVVETITVDD